MIEITAIDKNNNTFHKTQPYQNPISPPLAGKNPAKDGEVIVLLWYINL